MAGFIPDALSQDYVTPEWILAAVRASFGVDQIDLDPCSNDSSIVHAKTEYKLPQNNGLEDSWDFPTVYVNPPFSISRMHKVRRDFDLPKPWKEMSKAERSEWVVSNIGSWLKRCSEATGQAMALVPASSDTKAWKKYVWPKADGICWLDKRVKFINPITKVEMEAVIPKPMVLIYYAGSAGIDGYRRFEAACGKIGEITPVGKMRKRLADELEYALKTMDILRADAEQVRVEQLAVQVKALDLTKAKVLLFEGRGTYDLDTSLLSKLRQVLRERKLVPEDTVVVTMPDIDFTSYEELQPIIDKLQTLRDVKKLTAELT